MAENVNASQQLIGTTLDGGWKVLEAVELSSKTTGGHFSHGYLVEKADGKKQGFLKALDYSRALRSADPARALQAMTTAFNFERDILKECGEKNLSRIVRAIGTGKVQIDSTHPDTLVEYLIFELAKGDVRSVLDVDARFDEAFSLRTLHHVAVGLKQLHGLGIAHQDVKPSNVLVFETEISKVGDLGRASKRNQAGPHDSLRIPGDTSYAPLELLYGQLEPDWNRRRFGCDAYLLGSMVAFFFADVSMTALVQAELPAAYHWSRWNGEYAAVLPHLRHALANAILKVESLIPLELRSPIAQIIHQLCDPDPDVRGHPTERLGHGNRLSLERYVSQFNLLARRAEIMLARK